MSNKPFNLQRIRHAAAAAGLLLAATGAAQQQVAPNSVALEAEEEEVRRYSVELIIFEYVGAAAGSTEVFAAEDMTDPIFAEDFLIELPPDTVAERVTVVDPVTGTVRSRTGPPLADEELQEIPTPEQAGLRMLPPEEYQMTQAWDKLVRLDAYRPLLHTAWEQPTLEEEETAPIRLRRLGNPPLRLDGTISLYLSRYLHLVIDLELEEKQPARMTATRERVRSYGDNSNYPSMNFDRDSFRPSVFYRIHEDRIVRNNEVRYYDHPKFGVIARITRIEELQQDDMDTTGDLLPAPAN